MGGLLPGYQNTILSLKPIFQPFGLFKTRGCAQSSGFTTDFVHRATLSLQAKGKMEGEGDYRIRPDLEEQEKKKKKKIKHL